VFLLSYKFNLNYFNTVYLNLPGDAAIKDAVQVSDTTGFEIRATAGNKIFKTNSP
jgi:hypothetical protein